MCFTFTFHLINNMVQIIEEHEPYSYMSYQEGVYAKTTKCKNNFSNMRFTFTFHLINNMVQIVEHEPYSYL